MFSPKQNLRMILVCVCMLVFPAWAEPSKSRSDDDKPSVLEVIWGVVDMVTSCRDDDYVQPLYHYSVGVRYEHTLQNRKNIIEDEDVLINGVSAGCAVWLNYADFAGVKCDVRFGLYL